METSPPHRRRFSRFPCEGAVAFVGWPETCELLDVSLHGVLVASPVPIHPGDEVDISIMLAGSEHPIAMRVRAAHETAGQVGFECMHISIEGMTELRRLAELNLGDSALLRREFNALIDATQG